jgi:Domain of unknown function (DUF1851)
MYDSFLKQYPRDPNNAPVSQSGQKFDIDALEPFFETYGHSSFAGGVYRVVGAEEVQIWSNRVIEAFPQYNGRIVCFAYDWLGRSFALDCGRIEENNPGVILFEPGTGEALEIPCNLQTFHTDELVEYGEPALAISFFENWLSSGGSRPQYSQCIGYKKPLFLGGEDVVENLEVCDLDVYWHLCSQMLKKVRGIPPGTPINII